MTKPHWEVIIKHNNIDNVTCDSRDVNPHSIFVAIKGFAHNGNDFIPDAIKKGVKIIVTEEDGEKFNHFDQEDVKIYHISYPARIALAEIASIIYPQKPSKLLAVTGSKGKSSLVHYLKSFLDKLGVNAASIGTIGIKTSSNVIAPTLDEIPMELTSADPITLHKALQIMAKSNIDYCTMEASSIGLDQYRLHGLKFAATAFTSFSQDHLDYHGDMENYFKCKLKLFSNYMAPGSSAVINNDMQETPQLLDFLAKHSHKVITVGSNGDYKIKLLSTSLEGQHFSLTYKDQTYNLFTPILGFFQIYNITIAIAMLCSIGFNLTDLLPIIGQLPPLAGRLERAAVGGKASQIFIDYSHKPGSLKAVLQELKTITNQTRGRLITVFGCGGNRDKLKRPIMGQIASELSDIVIITDDNPRLEDASQIRQEILQDCPKGIEISPRSLAISEAISQLEKDDIVLIAGKGDEDYQIIGTEKIPFNDKEEVLKSLSRNS